MSSVERSESEPLRLGIVGCGFVAQNRHLPTLERIHDIEVVALADVDSASAERTADAWGIPSRYASADELADDPAVEAVAVLVPATHHADVALAALERGKHAFIEKPLALSLEDADRIVARARRSPAHAMVGFNLRWHRLVQQARALLQDGAIGPVHGIRSLFSDSRISQPDLPAWRLRQELGGGALFEKGVHHFDLWRYLLADEVVDVFARSRSDRGEDETVSVTARLRGGALADALLTDLTSTSNELMFYGDRGALELDLYRSDGLRLVSLDDLPGAPRTRLRRLAASAGQLGANVNEIRRGGVFDATYEAEWRHFVNAIRADRAPDSSVEDGRSSLAITLAAAHSAATGEPVTVEAAEAARTR